MLTDEDETPALITQIGGEGEAAVDPVLAIRRAADAGDAVAIARALGAMVDAMKTASGPVRLETFVVDSAIRGWAKHGLVMPLVRAKCSALRTAARLDDATGRRAKVVLLAREVVMDAAMHGNCAGAGDKAVRAWEIAVTVYDPDTLRRAVLRTMEGP